MYALRTKYRQLSNGLPMMETPNVHHVCSCYTYTGKKHQSDLSFRIFSASDKFFPLLIRSVGQPTVLYSPSVYISLRGTYILLEKHTQTHTRTTALRPYVIAKCRVVTPQLECQTRPDIVVFPLLNKYNAAVKFHFKCLQDLSG